MAEEFFSGDVMETFAVASELNIDGEQLAKVKVKLDFKERLNIAHAMLASQAPAVDGEATTAKPTTAITPVAEPGMPSELAGATAVTTAAAAEQDPSALSEGVAAAGIAGTADQGAVAPEPVTLLVRSLTEILDVIGEIIAKLMEAFDVQSAQEEGGEQYLTTRFDFGFKLSVFEVMLYLIEQSEGQDPLPETVSVTVSALKAEQQPPVEITA